ncbi:hypothetical protein K503DRAFT_728580 [Rhizopogon vinicolor AM-OR11-026]|uniref:BZIP domain-containing protein n=1 Tax=Rhizopogon vinicolor AM-OR11-026 TaxID=1314800 RepID=A0A1B7NIR5_9AGAM|nr:hypothetical protein K503DRAFT_728580 [Rhizopogon vinicolor AM-OR11-026]
MYPPGHLSVPPQVPPEAYTYLIHALLSMQGAIPPPPAHSTQSVEYLQGLFPCPSASSVSPHVPHQAMHSEPPFVMPSTESLSHFSSSNTSAMATPHSASFHANAPSDAGDTADEAAIVAEDKRRRNTSASARFRIKKKQRTLNLERTVADLTGRAEELEREASDLRRENSWLKEIVLLKGGRMSAFSSSQSSSTDQSNSSSTQGNSRKDGASSDMIGDSHATHK